MTVEVNKEDLAVPLCVAMRYSMGRMTYMPGLVQDLIKTHVKVFTNENLRQLAEEITSEHRVCQGKLGMDCDTKGWLEFRDWLLATADAGVIFPVPVPPAPDLEPHKGQDPNGCEEVSKS